jgi:hypothetical protein
MARFAPPVLLAGRGLPMKVLRTALASCRRALCFLLALGLLPWLSGCLVIEKKTLVLLVPQESAEVRLLYVFEGLSVARGDGSSLENAVNQMNNLRRPGLGFFVNGADLFQGQGEPPLLKHFRFQAIRFYRDPSRQRQLCADRPAVICDRDQFATGLNSYVTEAMRDLAKKTVNEVQADLKKVREDANSPDKVKQADLFGMRPLLKAGADLAQLAEGFDQDSVRKVLDAAGAEKGFRWIRFEPDTIRLVFPVTRACALRVVGDPGTATWLKEMRTFVEPLHLEAGEEGLVIVVGEKGKAIRFTFTDPRPYRADLEAALRQRAGNPDPILFGGRPASAEQLIERFVKGGGVPR